jgi:hypothetical protein
MWFIQSIQYLARLRHARNCLDGEEADWSKAIVPEDISELDKKPWNDSLGMWDAQF